MKKIIASILIAVLALTMSIPAFAAKVPTSEAIEA